MILIFMVLNTLFSGVRFGILDAIKPTVKEIEEKVLEKRKEEINYAPSLMWLGTGNYQNDGVCPLNGTSTTTFTFKIKYTDPDGDPPLSGYPKLYIKKNGGEILGSPFTMSLENGDFKNGAIYSYSIVLEAGDYSYYFECYDIYYASATGSPTVENQGPSVTEAENSPPELYWIDAEGYFSDGVEPDYGSIEDTYCFKILYKDLDDDSPLSGYPVVHILDENEVEIASYTLVEADDSPFYSGRLYQFYITFNDTGSYKYYFECYDEKGNEATGSPTYLQDGPKVSFNKKWTIMFFMSYDNDLEYFGLADLIEITSVGSSKEVNLIVQFDRNPNYNNDAVVNINNWTTCKRFYVKKNELKEIEDLGEVNMGSYTVLSDFVIWSIKNYPADNYVIILGNHGASWWGFGIDETSNDDLLTLEELDTAFLEAKQKTGILGFDLIGFDACLQADIQTVYIMKNYGKYMVASEELEPGFGWNYSDFLSYLVNNPDISSLDLAKKICDSYKAFFDLSSDSNIQNQGGGITLSVIDLENVSQLETAIDGFGSALKNYVLNGRDYWLEVAWAKEGVENYGGVNYSAVDLYHLSKLMMDKTSDAYLRERAYNTMQAIDNAVIYRIKGDFRPYSHGISIYFPYYKEHYDTGYDTNPFCDTILWWDFLTSYLEIEADDTTAPQVTGIWLSTDTISVSNNEIAICTATITGENDDIAWIRVFIGEDIGGRIIVYNEREISLSTNIFVGFDGYFTLLSDGVNDAPIGFETFQQANTFEEAVETGIIEYFATSKAYYLPSYETDWSKAEEITLYFSLSYDTSSIRLIEEESYFIYAMDDTTPIEFSQGDKIRIKRRYLDGSMGFTNKTEDFDGTLTIGSDGILEILEDYLEGNYYIGVLTVDYAGNYNWDKLDITVSP